jgi:ubiquinone/menaquinone biosynthesis C-methylase UbiE
VSHESSEAMEAEFDTIAVWTEQVAEELGPDYAIPAACRGSGSESWLTWLADALQVRPHEPLLDAGAGLGGPAAWLREHRGGAPILAEPMEGACASARRLFGMPTVAAWSEALPFDDGAFEVGWLLGVLCTTTQKREVLGELRRVLRTRGRLGLLVLVRVVDQLGEAPDGNEFPTHDSLHDDLTFAGFTIETQANTKTLPTADAEWKRRLARVEELLDQRCKGHVWEEARHQEKLIGGLLRSGDVETWLLCVRATG